MSETIRVAIVDDHLMMLESIVAVLSMENDIEIVGSGSTADDAIELARRQQPNVVLLDMNLPGQGLTALTRISQTCPDVKVIILTMRDDHDAVGRALALGARGYVLKGVSSTELCDIIRIVNDGGFFVSKSLAASMGDRLRRRRAN